MPNPSTNLPENDVQLLEQASAAATQMRRQLSEIIVGQDEVIRALLAAVFSQGHTLIIGVPGLAKTLLVKTLAHVLGWKFKRIQFTPDMMPADIIGMELLQEDPTTGRRNMEFVPGPVFANLVLADEINRAPPKTQSALLEAMQELTVTSMGRQHRLEKPFVVVATQNPIEQEGTYPLPEAQLDRFMFSLCIDYPSEEHERAIAALNVEQGTELQTIYSHEQMLAFQALVRRIPVSQHVVDYAVALTRATRPTSPTATSMVKTYVEWGAGPRASQHLILAARALALLDGQAAVSAAHIRQAAPNILRHRILANYNATGEGITPAQIVERVLAEVKEPTYAAV